MKLTTSSMPSPTRSLIARLVVLNQAVQDLLGRDAGRERQRERASRAAQLRRGLSGRLHGDGRPVDGHTRHVRERRVAGGVYPGGSAPAC
jgi:hypothetical protein